MPSVFLAFVVAISATGDVGGATRLVADEAMCRQVVNVTVLQAQAQERRVVAAGCHEVELVLGQGA